MSFITIKRALINYWKKERPFILIVVAITLIAGILRMYKLEEFMTFLGDQGRDAIVMKRIMTLEDFPGIGPRSSMGQLFLGPFYYYFMAPFLLPFGFSPVGPAFGVALLSTLAIFVFTFKLKKEVNTTTAIVFGLIAALSYVNIWLARFSWNPNLLPVFSFFTAYFLWRLIRKPGIVSGAFFGFFLAASLQLHYLMLLVLPALFGYLVYGIWIHKKKMSDVIRSAIAAAISFVITISPLIIFDLKNNFLNLRGLIGIFTEDGFKSNTSHIDRLNNVLNNLVLHVFQIPMYGKTGFILLAILLLVALLGWRYRKQFSGYIYMHVVILLSFILMFSLVDSERYQHYFTPVYYSFFAIIAYLISLVRPKGLLVSVAIIFVAVYGWLNAKEYWFFHEKGNFQTHISESIADTIISMNIAQPYHIVSIPLTETNDHVRYFLELKGKTPLPAESMERAEHLVILCYEKGKDSCKVFDDAQYQIVIFGDRKIAKEINHKEGVRIFKLIHAK